MSTSELFDADQDSESVTFAPVEDEFFLNDPSLGNSSTEPAFALPESSNDASQRSNSVGASLLERIQQQRHQQNSAVPPFTCQSQQRGNLSGPDEHIQAPASSENPFGYPMVEDNNVFTSSVPNPGPTGNVNMNIPDYATSSNLPNSYEASDLDYKEKLFSFVSAAGNLTKSAAKGIYRGTTTLYGNIMNRSSNGLVSQQERMAEMDYQRQSLLLDPHEVEDGVPNTSSMDARFGTGFDIDNQHLNSADSGRHPLLDYGKQFCVDLKDIFLGLSRRAQVFVILFLVFIIWLFISEEWGHSHHDARH